MNQCFLDNLLTTSQIQQIQQSDAEKSRQLINEFLKLPTLYPEIIKRDIFIEWSLQCFNFAFSRNFDSQKIIYFISLMKNIFFAVTVSPPPSISESFSIFQEYIMQLSFDRPPFSILAFTLEEVKIITNFFCECFIRHIKLYQCVFCTNLESRIEQLNLEEQKWVPLQTNILICFNIQNDFGSNGTIPNPMSSQVIPLITTLKENSFFTKTIILYNELPPDSICFYSVLKKTKNIKKSKIFQIVEIKDNVKILVFPDYCVSEKGRKLLFETSDNDTIIKMGSDKNYPPHSIFHERDGKEILDINSILQSLHITDLYLVGLAAEFQLYNSCVDALSNEYHCHIVEDAIGFVDESKRKSILEELKEKGANITSSNNLA